MPDIVLDLLKFLFLAVLYIFIARAIRSVYVDLREADPAAPVSPRTQPQQSSRRTRKAPTKLTIVEGDKKGQTVPLNQEVVIGRGDKCALKLDDTYVSTMHARIFSKGDAFMLEDLGSTNGTYVNRRRITAPVELQRGDQVKIGKTVMELRK